MMDVYLYQADLYCKSCGEKIAASLSKPEGFPDEHTYDSDDYPKGPYGNGGGEADFPQHCGGCGVHLENPLTKDGEDYVRSARKDGASFADWRAFYSYLWED